MWGDEERSVRCVECMAPPHLGNDFQFIFSSGEKQIVSNMTFSSVTVRILEV